jgi:hypothetical protein
MTGDAAKRTAVAVPNALKAAGALYVALGLGFGIGAAVTLNHYAREGELPMTPFGFRSLAGPFEELGPEQFSALGWALVAVCAVDVLAGLWLLQGRRLLRRVLGEIGVAQDPVRDLLQSVLTATARLANASSSPFCARTTSEISITPPRWHRMFRRLHSV